MRATGSVPNVASCPGSEFGRPYRFDGPDGPETLAYLFAGPEPAHRLPLHVRPRLGEGCRSCSYLADHFDGAAIHLAHRDVTLVAISRAPWPELAAFKRRMGWSFSWVSSFANDFNRDFHVSFTPELLAKGDAAYNFQLGSFPVGEAPGASVFYKEPDGGISTPIRLMPAGSTSWSAPTTSSTWHPRAATRTGSRSPWSGSGTTTGIPCSRQAATHGMVPSFSRPRARRQGVSGSGHRRGSP